MVFRRSMGRWLVLMAAVAWLSACQTQSVKPAGDGAQTPAAAQAVAGDVSRLDIDIPMAWNGEVRCGVHGCRLATVEHEASNVVVYQLDGRKPARLLGRQKVAYHPDSAKWLSDDLLAAAVEVSGTLDIFRVEASGLKLVKQIEVGLAPTDVTVVSAENGRYRLLATPYGGEEVTWVDYDLARPEAANVVKRKWCEAPWYPVHVSRAPGAPQGGLAVACLDAQRVVFVPQNDLLGAARTLAAPKLEQPRVMRQARPSPSGRWLYVAMETGERNFRVDMDNGELQWTAYPPTGAVAALPLSDDLVIWGDDMRLLMQRLDGQGKVLETRYLPVDGFATNLQSKDVDGDGEADLIVFNATALKGKKGVNILFGPLWERAARTWPPQ